MFTGANHILSGDEAMAAHSELVNYWMSKCQDDVVPARDDIHPKDFKKHLPTISLIDVDSKTEGAYRMRLAGTGLRDLYDKEITGLSLEDVYPDDMVDYWRDQLRSVTETAKPAAGAKPLDWQGKGHLVQLWSRLPLSKDGKTINMILAFDSVVAAPNSPEDIDVSVN